MIACFENALKTGLVILVNGTGIPETHQANFKSAVRYYKKLTGAKVFSSEGKRIRATCMVSMDEDIYIAVGAESFTDYLQRATA